MKRLIRIVFEYDDKTADEIVNPKAAALFQARCNSNGLLAGLQDFIFPVEDVKDKESV